MKKAPNILCLIALGALAACSVQTVTRIPDATNLEARAAAEVEAGNLATAAQLYRQLADAGRGTQRAGFLIEAARLLITRGERGTARQWLTEALTTADDTQRKVAYVLDARMELDENRPELALRSLDGIQGPTPVELMVDIAEVRGRALFALDRPAEAIAELVEREVWLDDAETIIDNQRIIWDGLAASLPPGRTSTGDPIVDGWLALSPLAGGDSESLDFRRSLIEWRSVFTDHPAAGGLLAEILSERRLGRAAPTQIALLLPLASAQREFAVAIRDGFFAAHLAGGARRESTIRIYDTSTLGAQEAYLRAQLEGADYVVGPLLRPNVEQIVAQAGFVPTLTLNYSQIDAPFLNSMHQFALAPEDEAQAVARRAIASGARTAVAIIVSNDWGYRVLDAFRTEFEARGGRVLDFAGYDPSLQDFTPQITTLLNIERSEQRRRRLAANLGIAVQFEARRRQDVDMIFLGADTARAGRLLASQLQFHSAGDIPTYATSEVYEPGAQASDADMNGVMFPDVPLLVAPDAEGATLGRELQTHWPRRAPQLMRFYGMGFDAYRLMQGLYSADPFWPLAGVTGSLSVDGNGRIHRALPFAQFQNGRPSPIPDLETLDSDRFIGAR